MKKIILCIMAIGFIAYTQAQDLALESPFGKLLQPVSGCSLTSTENVTLRIFNFGSNLPAGTAFNVTYELNAGMPITELVVLSSTLLTNSSLTYSFTTRANLSVPGYYTITAIVSLPGDINTANNHLANIAVINSAGSIGGSINGSTSACASGNSGTLTLTSFTGDIIRWEYSNDNGNTWYYISNTTSTQNYLNLKTTTRYRAVIRHNNCGTVFSSIATITINC